MRDSAFVLGVYDMLLRSLVAMLWIPVAVRLMKLSSSNTLFADRCLGNRVVASRAGKDFAMAYLLVISWHGIGCSS